MIRIRKVEYIDHPILGNLKLDFRGPSGNAVDTVILAGENGTGKSTILDALYSIATAKVSTDIAVEVENDEKIRTLKYRVENRIDGHKIMQP